jgi:hypothetical protein
MGMQDLYFMCAKMVYHPKGGGGCLADVLCKGMGAKRSRHRGWNGSLKMLI